MSILVLILSICFGLFNCTKSSNVKWVYYDQTVCSDKWGSYTNNEDLKIKIKDYFDSKNIEVYDTEIFNTGTPDSCLDCYCKTGKKIKLKIKKRDLDAIKSEGFYE